MGRKSRSVYAVAAVLPLIASLLAPLAWIGNGPAESASPADPSEVGLAPEDRGVARWQNLGAGPECGEPTIGVTAANNIFFRCEDRTTKSTNNGSSFTPVRFTSFVSFDPMLWVDPVTSRIFMDDLTIACSTLSVSTNEGATWGVAANLPNPAACGTPGNDHQKIVSGPWVPGTPRNPGLHSRAVFYCYSGVVYSACSLSPDGGLTWEPAVPATGPVGLGSGAPTLDRACGGLHGHPHIALNGAIYLPHYNCSSTASVSVSTDEGLTWRTRLVSGTGSSTDGDNDPDVTSTPNGRVWMTWINRANVGGTVKSLPYVAYSDNQGVSWTTMAVGLGTNTVNTATFPTITSGDNGRVAVSFLGTSSTGGNAGPEGVASSAVWHVFVAITYNNGTAWTTDQATTDPVQRGTICMGGTTCGADRNLLDFIDSTVDKYGTVLVAYADGCTTTACTAATGTPSDSRSSQGKVARQDSGDTLYSAWDAFF